MRDDNYQPKSPGLIELMRQVSADPKRVWLHTEVAAVVGCAASASVVRQWTNALVQHGRLHYKRTQDNRQLYRGDAFDSADMFVGTTNAPGAPQPLASDQPPAWAPRPMTAPRAGSDHRLPKTAPGTPPLPAPQVQGRDFSAPTMSLPAQAPTPAPTPRPTAAPTQPPATEPPSPPVPVAAAPKVKTCEELHAELLRARPAAPTPAPFRASFDTDGRLVIHGAVPQADGSILLDKPEATKLRDLLAWRPL